MAVADTERREKGDRFFPFDMPGAYLEGAKPAPPPKLGKYSTTHTVENVWNVSTRGILWHTTTEQFSRALKTPICSLWTDRVAHPGAYDSSFPMMNYIHCVPKNVPLLFFQ